MKLRTITIIVLAATVASLNINFKIEPKNPPAAKTGAPGETTCQTSGCHAGGSFKGSVVISGLPDSVVTNTTYTIKISTKSTGPARNGFEMTCLTSSKTACGTFSNVSGTSIAVASLKQYIRQSNFKTFSGDSVVWTVKWKAPAAKSDSAFFYFASLLANGNGNETGDNCLSGKKKFYYKNTATAIVETAENSDMVSILNNSTSNVLSVQLAEYNGQIWIYNMQGQLIQSQQLTFDNKIDIGTLNKGMHIAIVKVGNREYTQKFMKM